jgi:CheY-like chemotaxis protein
MCDASRNASRRPREQTEPVMPWVNSLRCVIVDDNRHFIESAVNLLECDGITVVGSAPSSAEALQLVDELCPDVTLVDVDLGTESGFELAEQIHRRDASGARQPRVILISAHSEQDFADLVAASPAMGFVPKLSLSARLIREMLGQA